MTSDTPARSLPPALMDRREAILRVSVLLGGSMVGSSALLSGCVSTSPRTGADLFTASDIEYMDEIAETILPATGTPGAKAARVGEFMAVMVADTYDASEQATFSDGLIKVDDECRDTYGMSFMAASPAQRTALLERLDLEQFNYMRERSADDPVHYFRMLKELTVTGYYTSEIGYTQAQRYVESPGRFDPCIPYEAGDRAWAPHA